jgi:2-methylisocitrate lyase-like PEP mutase family enzyme
MNGPRKLRELLSMKKPVLAPGAYDALTARLIEAAGFDAVYMTGFGTAASRLGRPDVGLLTMSETVDNASRMVETVNIPVIADADSGYGNAISVIRTVREYERTGVAAIHIEDQISPNKCGLVDGIRLVPADEMKQKLRAAVSARQSQDFIIIARTDARTVEGLDAVLERGHIYREAGADMLFIENPQSEADIATIARDFKGIPLLFNWAEGGKIQLPLSRIREYGFSVIIFPLSILLTATKAIRDVLAEIRKEGTPSTVMDRFTTFSDFSNFIGLPEINELQKRFAAKTTTPARAT